MDLRAVFCCFLLFSFCFFSFRKSSGRRPAGQRLMLAAAAIAFLGMGSVVSADTAYVDYRVYNYNQAEYAEVLTGEETELGNNWYVAESNLTYDEPLTLTGDVNLILKDGAVLTMGGDKAWGIGNDSEP